jgi:hypothetical protein
MDEWTKRLTDKSRDVLTPFKEQLKYHSTQHITNWFVPQMCKEVERRERKKNCYGGIAHNAPDSADRTFDPDVPLSKQRDLLKDNERVYDDMTVNTESLDILKDAFKKSPFDWWSGNVFAGHPSVIFVFSGSRVFKPVPGLIYSFVATSMAPRGKPSGSRGGGGGGNRTWTVVNQQDGSRYVQSPLRREKNGPLACRSHHGQGGSPIV